MSQQQNVNRESFHLSLKDYLSLKGIMCAGIVLILMLSFMGHSDSLFIAKTALPMAVDPVQMENGREYRQQIPYQEGELSAFQIKFGTNGRPNRGILNVSLQRDGDELQSWSVNTVQLVNNGYKKFYVSSPFLLDSSRKYFIVLKNQFSGSNNIAFFTSNDANTIESGSGIFLSGKSFSVFYEIIDPAQKAFYRKLIFIFLFFLAAIAGFCVNPRNVRAGSCLILLVCGILSFRMLDYGIFQNIAKTEYIENWKQSQKEDAIEPYALRQYHVNLDYYVYFDTLNIYLNGTNRKNIRVKIIKDDGNVYFNNDVQRENIIGDGRAGKTAVSIYRQKKFSPGQYTVEIRNTGNETLKVSLTESGNLNFGITNHTFLAGKIALFAVAVLAIYAVLILVLICSSSSLTAEKWFLATAIPLSIVYLVLFTPTSQSDALDSHPPAVYRWSNKLLGFPENDIWKGRLEDAEFFQFLHSPYIGGGARQYPSLKNYSAVSNYARLNCEKPDTVSLPYRAVHMTYYSVINYLPQALGLTVGRLLNLSTVVSLYLAKIFILAVYIPVIYRNIKKIPVGKWIMATVATLPMAMMMSSAISYDPLVIVSSLSLITCIFRLRERNSKSVYLEALFWCFIVGAVKGGGYALILLPLSFMLFDPDNKKSSAFLIVGLLEAGLFSVLLFDKVLPSISGFQFGRLGGVMLTAAYAMQEPLVYLDMAVNTYLVQMDYLSIGSGGTHLAFFLTGFEQTIPAAFVALFMLTGGIQAIFEKDDIALRKSDWRIFIFILAVGILTIPAMLLKDTVIGSQTIQGIQGRYFLPLLPVFYFFITKFALHGSGKGSRELVVRKGAVWMSALSGIFIYYIMALYLTR